MRVEKCNEIGFFCVYGWFVVKFCIYWMDWYLSFEVVGMYIVGVGKG